MKLEQIDTSTTAGKAEVMRLASEGRKVAVRHRAMSGCAFCATDRVSWDWTRLDFAIITQPVGPDEVWVLINPMGLPVDVSSKGPNYWKLGDTLNAVRYRRVEE